MGWYKSTAIDSQASQRRVEYANDKFPLDFTFVSVGLDSGVADGTVEVLGVVLDIANVTLPLKYDFNGAGATTTATASSLDKTANPQTVKCIDSTAVTPLESPIVDFYV